MGEADNSDVFHVDLLDEEYAAAFKRTAPECPWVLDTDDEGQSYYTTEEKVYAAQREYRKRHGFDPMTGEKVKPAFKPAKLDAKCNCPECGRDFEGYQGDDDIFPGAPCPADDCPGETP